MPKATQQPTTPGTAPVATSRRILLGAAAALPLAAAFLPSAGASGVTDPMAALYRQFVDAEQRGEALSASAMALRTSLVLRWGHPTQQQPAYTLWAHDPDYVALRDLNDRCDSCSEESARIIDAMFAAPAMTLEAVLYKIRVALASWPRSPDFESDIHEDLAFDVLQDAARLLAGRVEL
ncbi:hypothetical protein [Limobrevibacterium gyesilva]|uniref:Uncharacterized protein n=1 Tax=Limobrevibacterium gyesilva TaxID=2991712 RepID=A0AA42CGQ4_9PROT|nr:hypothetical protein [Limobrevibacterium gyesilva]MCW3476326.1 hypothetical protein [Limobrevibacterium gyesilva]